jgi:hypothetical protein
MLRAVSTMLRVVSARAARPCAENNAPTRTEEVNQRPPYQVCEGGAARRAFVRHPSGVTAR